MIIDKKYVLDNLKAITKYPNGKHRTFDPKNLDQSVVRGIIHEFAYNNISLFQLVNYFDDGSCKLSRERLIRILSLVYECPYDFDFNLAKNVLCRLNKQEVSEKEVVKKRLPYIREQTHKNISTVKKAIYDYLNGGVSLEETLKNLGVSEEEFLYIQKYAACVFLPEYSYQRLRKTIYNRYANTRRVICFTFLCETEIFREKHKKLLKKLSYENTSKQKALYNKLNAYFEAPDAFRL